MYCMLIGSQEDRVMGLNRVGICSSLYCCQQLLSEYIDLLFASVTSFMTLDNSCLSTKHCIPRTDRREDNEMEILCNNFNCWAVSVIVTYLCKSIKKGKNSCVLLDRK